MSQWKREENKGPERVSESILLILIHLFVTTHRVKPAKPEPGEDPGAGLMQLMKKMYDDGDDEMKRTIKKAWFESQEKKNKGEL